MRKLIALVLLLAGLAAGQTTNKPRRAPVPAQRGPQRPLTDEQAGEQLRKRVQEILNAWSTLDPDNVAKFYAKDADLVFFELAPLSDRGWDEYYLGMKKLFGNYQNLNIQLKDEASLHWMGDMAYATGIWDVAGTLTDGRQQQMDLRWTVVLERRNGDWVVVHEHVSAPLPGAAAAAPPAKTPPPPPKPKDPFK